MTLPQKDKLFVWIVGWWIEYSGVQEEYLYREAHETDAYKKKEELKKIHTADYEGVYCYKQEVL
jgi:hypothetical protein